jgi:hypothetical protein
MADTYKFKFSPKKECYALVYEHTSSYTHTPVLSSEVQISKTADLTKQHGQSTKLHPCL